MRVCESCGTGSSQGMTYGVHAICNVCRDKAVEWYLSMITKVATQYWAGSFCGDTE